MMKRTLRDLIHAHAGRPAIVMGGGPSLPWAFVPFFNTLGLPADAVLISANAHGCRLADHGFCRRPDYIVCVDNIEAQLRPWGVPIIARREWADVVMFQKPVHGSGRVAAFVAWVLGCSPIILAGMDVYTGGVYYDDPDAFSPDSSIGMHTQIERWAQFNRLGINHRIRVLPGSPLAGVFPAYQPGEVPPLDPIEMVIAHTAGKRVRLLKSRTWRGEVLPAGTEIEMPPRPTSQWFKEGAAVRV